MHWFQKQHSFSYRHILGLAKISSSSCFFKGLKGIKVSTRFRWAESPRCLSFEGRPPLPTHASSPLLPPPQVLKRAQAKAVPHQHSSSSPLPLTFSLRILRQLMSLLKYSHPLLPNYLPDTKTQSPISKITFMPMTPPNLSPDLTCQQFYSHTLYCLPDSSNSDVHQHPRFSQNSLAGYTPYPSLSDPSHPKGHPPAPSSSTHRNANQPSELNSNDPSSSVFPHNPTGHHSSEFLLC